MIKIPSNKPDELSFLITNSVESGYIAKAINESIITEGNSIDELNRNITEAIECHFDGPIFPDFTLTFANLAE